MLGSRTQNTGLLVRKLALKEPRICRVMSCSWTGTGSRKSRNTIQYASAAIGSRKVPIRLRSKLQTIAKKMAAFWNMDNGTSSFVKLMTQICNPPLKSPGLILPTPLMSEKN